MLRRRFRFAFAFCALAVLAIVAATLWRFGLLTGAGAAGDDRLIAAVLLLAAVGGAFFYIWVSVEYRLLKPLDTLQGEVEAALHGPTHKPIDVAADTMVEPLGHAVERLVRLRERERHEFDRALVAATENLEDERRHLETMLRPLREGVVMCSAAHVVVLHNDAAYARLSRNAEFGLGRSIFEALARDDVEAAIARLDGDTDTVDTDVALTGDDARLSVRIARIRDAAGEVFVYSFDPATAHPRLPPRPVHYDFALLRRHAEPDIAPETPLRALDYVAFDTETTGLAPAKGDRIVQIAGVRIVNGSVLQGESFQRLVDPERPIPARSTRFHGITDDLVAQQPTIVEVLPAFRAFVGQAALITQNAAFDLAFLRPNEARAGVTFDMPVLDTMLLSMVLHPTETDHTLDGIMARYGVEVRGRHTALGDATATAEVFVRMLDRLEAAGLGSLGEARKASDRMARRLGRAVGYRP